MHLSDASLAGLFVHIKRDTPHIREGEPAAIARSVLEALPASYDAVYLGGGLLGISWDEGHESEVPEELVQALEKLKKELCST